MARALASAEQLPGFRRQIRITPQVGAVSSEFEDDYHRMSVVLHHDGRVATGIDAAMQRAPWDTCPGAAERLRRTFTGVPLTEFAARGEKRENCTHLFDLVVLCAAHAGDGQSLVYDVLVSDPVDGFRQAEIRRDGARVLGWTDEPITDSGYNRIVAPAELAGRSLDELRPWIQSLDPARQEAARVLQWCAIVANGRRMSVARHADASALAGSGRCYTFQEHRVVGARRIDDIRDFSQGKAKLLTRIL